jgi:hypothetical protein
MVINAALMIDDPPSFDEIIFERGDEVHQNQRHLGDIKMRAQCRCRSLENAGSWKWGTFEGPARRRFWVNQGHHQKPLMNSPVL